MFRIRPERDNPRIPAEFNTLPQQLFCNAVAVFGMPGEEGEDILLLQFPDDLHRSSVIRSSADNGRKPRHGAVNKLDTEVTLYRVRDKAVIREVLAVNGLLDRFKSFDVTKREQNLLCEQGSHT